MFKIWTIARKELYTFFADRNLVIIMIVTPLAIATIVGLAFGSLTSGDAPVSDIPVAIVNLDEGNNGQNFGDIFDTAFVPSDEGTVRPPACEGVEPSSDQENVLFTLTNAVTLDNPDEARAEVDKGTYTAAIIIPPDFTRRIGYGVNDPVESTSVEVYANGGRTLPATIIRSIVESITNQIATGNIAVAASLETVADQYGLIRTGTFAGSDSFASNIGCAFMPNFNTLHIDQQTVAGDQSNSAAALLVLFGSAQAMFFAMFTGQMGILSVFEERRQWTLQRLVMSPTPRVTILLGKLAGTFVTCFFQLVVLFIALTAVGSLLSGRFMLIWGNNLLGIVLVMLAAAAAVTGLGTLMAGIARTPEQSANFSQVLNVILALLGGAFGLQVPEVISRFSLIYWGSDAFRKLSANQGDITLNVLVLLAHGVILFGIGWWLFNRRLDI